MVKDEITEAKVLKALADIYEAVTVYNLKEKSCVPFRTVDYIVDSIEKYKDDIQKQANSVVMQITEPEDVDKMLEFVNFSTLDVRLKGKQTISEVFKDKTFGWCRARFTFVDYDDNGKLFHVIYSVACINEEKMRERQLIYLSQTDLMTDIYNRGYGEKTISEFLENGISGMFWLLDVDNFKTYNDKYGHDVGDKVLISIADVLKRNKRSEDIIMRLGGDEFAAYFIGIDNKEKANKVFQRIFNDINLIKIPSVEEKISVSIGTYFYKDGINFDYAYKAADKGVYLSKKIKDNSVHFE